VGWDFLGMLHGFPCFLRFFLFYVNLVTTLDAV